MMTAVTKLALGLLAATTVAADSRLNLRFSPLLISSLVAATADAAYLRKAGQSPDSASDSLAAEQPFYRLWDSGAVMYYLDPEDYGEPEVTEICIGTSWTYLGGLFRKSKVDEDAPPAADLSYPAGSAPACREVSLVLNLATNADGVEDPQPIFDYAATGACAAVDE